MENHVCVIAIRYAFTRDERDVVSGKRATYRPARFPHTTLRPVAPHRIPKLLARNKSNTTIMVVLSFGA